MKAEIDLEAVTIIEKDTDDRGRITLGREWGDQRVRVLVESADPSDE